MTRPDDNTHWAVISAPNAFSLIRTLAGGVYYPEEQPQLYLT
jgi:hypothetical protein